MPEKDDALAAEAASQDDQDSARSKGGAEFGGADGFVDLMNEKRLVRTRSTKHFAIAIPQHDDHRPK